MNILSIQSHVAYGHVGNAAAVFVLQRLGHEVWPLNTLQFSNHPGHGRFGGPIFTADAIDHPMQALADLGVLAACDGVLTGYMGTRDNAAAALRAVAAVRRANPGARHCCDPVLGDAGRLYVPAELAAFLVAAAVPQADVLTPNLFELSIIADMEIRTRETLDTALDAVHRRGPGVILVTSADLEMTPADAVDCVVSAPDGRFLARTPRLATAVHGAGDALAALFFAHWLVSGSAPTALGVSLSALYGVLRATADAGAAELRLVAAQEELVHPSMRIEPIRL